MAGALAERVFADKITNVGFADIAVLQRRAFGLADAARYPLFTPDLIEAMKDLLTPDQQTEVATAITVTAHKPA